MQYFTIKKVKKLTGKPIINHCLVKIISIINRLFAIIEKRYNIWDDIKLILLFESLLSEFNQRKAYILVNQNIISKEKAIFLANNEV